MRGPLDPVVLSGPIDGQLELTFRALGRLKYAKITTVFQLIQMTERDLLDIPFLGNVILMDIKAALAMEGLSLRSPSS